MADIVGAPVLALLDDSVTTDHISPAGNIRECAPAGQYRLEQGVAQADFNSYGSRRGNHNVMIRDTFANIRLRNLLVPGVEGGFTKRNDDGEMESIFEVSNACQEKGASCWSLLARTTTQDLHATGLPREPCCWVSRPFLLLPLSALTAPT